MANPTSKVALGDFMPTPEDASQRPETLAKGPGNNKVTRTIRPPHMRQEQIGDALLIHGDAFAIMPSLGEVDCIITDPPYNTKTHKGARSAKSLTASQIDFDGISEEQFIEFCGNAVAQARRWVVMSCAWQHAAQLEKTGVPLVRLGVWTKKNAAPQFTGDRPGVGWEAIAILHREGKKRWNGGGHHAVWACNVEHGDHPTQKPLPLLMDWVTKFTDAGETILDPFMGSATTGIACAKLGRKFIGIEKEQRYFELAVRRLTDFYSQSDMFAANCR